MPKFTVCILGIISLLSLLTSVAYGDSDRAQIQLQLRWFHQFQFAGYYMAKEKGYYQQAGLDVTIKAGGYGITPVIEVLNGQAQYGVGNMEVLALYQQGEPLIALSAIFQHSPSILLVRKNSSIYSAGDLRGKKVMLFPGHDDPEILAMLYQQGLGPNDFQRLDTSKDINDLINGKTDAFNAYLTNEPFFMEEKDVGARIINPRDYGIDFYSDVLFTTRDELHNHPERVQAFRKASLKGWEYALDHPEEVIQLLVEQYQVHKTQDHMRYESHMVREMILPRVVELGYMSEKRWHDIAQQLANLGLIPKDFSLTGFLYQQKPGFDWQRWGHWVIGTLLLTSIFVVLSLQLMRINRKLNKEVRQRKQAEEHARYLSLHDALTGLPNRKLLMDRLDMACHRAQRGESHPAVLFIDLDGFKRVNDSCGHSVGDQLLCQTAELLSSQLRARDTLARLGGDEFIVLLDDPVAREKAHTVAEKLLASLSQLSCNQTDDDIQVSASIGITTIQQGDSACSVISRSDQAMYHVKSHGKHGIAHYQDLVSTE